MVFGIARFEKKNMKIIRFEKITYFKCILDLEIVYLNKK